MVVKLYGQVTAACPQRVLLCFLEKGIEFEIIHIDLDTFEQKKPEHLLRQPFGQVPAIEDGDFKLFESRAIARYYATKFADQGTNLLGKSLEHRAIVDQWADVETYYFNVLAQPLVINLIIKPRLGEKCDVVLVEDLKVKLGVVLDIYNNRLSSNRFLAGEEFTMADLTHMPAMGYLMSITDINQMVKARGSFNRWWEEISDRPSWKKLMVLAGH
ncbi:glutathione S-transferase-like protein [Arabidopsis thaliana]|jgi:glutathione S-transferase|uniref:Glutathione S-transferase F12 n=1 Tax=Arabidopsis thaliana TaxID=3702 RepID=GSTFC_ARATH|nr:glutathione S-transferase phi 12 [Arabidopsis thaliana]Q9FE46.1 RecName: Full=Glutathione S-transferase F12; Short=AtGSTF12; AltName: Full=GST class-phi member 12; AltName: Full=Glutathione S-transferase 26; AltName: Full=Protein TRANSPARENT TESTA 19 [Arabidopsis thaliana]AAG30138.1 glutathione S-transferase [Arabidopsis thaliana]AED92398.1 glutathione S-transferase phi 12 [Arabidopsis thaliana]BAB10509.1 glutathione S-transferase-like protein [Arabidopsis thaliana]|eukprot:NP_197224.1 glutathione S-transferase phi 12 [Arabidopsis thaliana]